MASSHTKREFGRGERILPGLWRLRLTLPLPGVPHCNAWAISAGDGLVLVDCGMHELAAADHPASIVQLETAMAQVGLRVEQVRKLVITHAHADHWGQAGPVIDRSGAEMWMHPDYRHATAGRIDRKAALARDLEIGRQSGVPERALETYAGWIREHPSGVARAVAPDQLLRDGVEIDTDLGVWRVYETPGHAPSHICLHQADRRILISGDHLLGRISLYFDYGWTPDPVAEFLRSLDVVEPLDARLALSGHGRPFTDVQAHIDATRATVHERLRATQAALDAVDADAATAVELAPSVFGAPLSPELAPWRLTELLCFLTHLERRGAIAHEPDDTGAERWHSLG